MDNYLECWGVCMDIFRVLLKERNETVFIMQHKLSKRDVYFYIRLGKKDIKDDNVFSLSYTKVDIKPRKILLTHDQWKFYLIIHNHLKENKDSKCKMILSLSKTYCIKLYNDLCMKTSQNDLAGIAKDEVGVVTTDNKDDIFSKEFLLNPKQCINKKKNIIVSPFLTTRHSIEGCFLHVFGYFPARITTNKTIYLMFQRVTHHKDVVEPHIIYAPKGKPGKYSCDYEYLLHSIEYEEMDDIMKTINSDVELEKNDDVNCHAYYFIRNKRDSQVYFIDKFQNGDKEKLKKEVVLFKEKMK